jgi:hypothetical protein
MLFTAESVERKKIGLGGLGNPPYGMIVAGAWHHAGIRADTWVCPYGGEDVPFDSPSAGLRTGLRANGETRGGLGNPPYGMVRDMQARDRHGEIAAASFGWPRNDMEAVEYLTSLCCGFLI